MKHWQYSLVALAMAISLFAAFASAQEPSAKDKQGPVNLLKNGDAETGTLENWKKWSKTISKGVHGGKHCFKRETYGIIYSKEYIPVDPEKTTTLSGWLKSDGKVGSKTYFGFMPLDKNKHRIYIEQVYALPKTEATLAEACKKEDTVITIANGANWKAHKLRLIAFDIDDSGKYADLPNRNLSPLNILKVEKEGEVWKVTLAKPCGQTFPAGTKVRLHRAGSAYLYTGCGGANVPHEWTQYTGKVKGFATFGYSENQWWPGTKFTRIVILANYRQKEEAVLLADDISVTVEDK
jgi:hypothetical protein